MNTKFKDRLFPLAQPQGTAHKQLKNKIPLITQHSCRNATVPSSAQAKLLAETSYASNLAGRLGFEIISTIQTSLPLARHKINHPAALHEA